MVIYGYSILDGRDQENDRMTWEVPFHIPSCLPDMYPYINIHVYIYIYMHILIGGSTPLKHSQLGLLSPICGKQKRSKPPTSIQIHIYIYTNISTHDKDMRC